MHADPNGNRRYELQAVDIGHIADEALSETGHWTVIAVHSRSLYARSTVGSVVCVGDETIGSGALNVTCVLSAGADWSGLGFTAGEAGRRTRGGLELGSRVRVDFGSVTVWKPRSFVHALPEVLRSRIADLRAKVPKDAPHDGFAPLIASLIAGTIRDESPKSGPLTRALAEGAGAVDEWLRIALRGTDTVEPANSARELIGLGVGLTPSGDDFIGGALIALRALGLAELADRLSDWLLPRISGRTNIISAAHLACAVRGSGGAVIHAALADLAAENGGGVEKAVAAISDFGHASGWDALAGMLVVLRRYAARAG